MIFITLAFLEVCFRRGTGHFANRKSLTTLLMLRPSDTQAAEGSPFMKIILFGSSGRGKWANRTRVELCANKTVSRTMRYKLCTMVCSWKPRGTSSADRMMTELASWKCQGIRCWRGKGGRRYIPNISSKCIYRVSCRQASCHKVCDAIRHREAYYLIEKISRGLYDGLQVYP